MSTGYEPGMRTTMYATAAAAAAAFADPPFVALMVNLPRILPRRLPRGTRAGGAGRATVSAGRGDLDPGQPREALGIELLCLAAALAAVSICLQGQMIRRLQPGRRASGCAIAAGSQRRDYAALQAA
jgi:hypothetical protein